MTETSVDIKIRILWGNLSCDAHSVGFLNQKVSVGTVECPTGSRVADDKWIFPPDICTKHVLRARVLNFDIPLGKKSLVDPEYAELLLWSKRYMIAVLSRPIRNILHLATVKNEFHFVKALVIYVALECRMNSNTSLASLSATQAMTFALSISAGWSGEHSFLSFENFIRRIQKYGEQGLTGDNFNLEAFRAIMISSKNKLSNAKHWSQAKAAKTEAAIDEVTVAYPPLPDDYCRRVLGIAHFYRDILANHFIAHARKYMELLRKNEPTIRYSEWAQAYAWPVSKLPFDHVYQFPPNNWRQTSLLITLMQTANAHEVLLFTGARSCEFLMMNQGCLSQDEDEGTLNSIRFKNSPALGGTEVSWPIPQCVVDAVKAQIKLAKAVGASSALWLAPRALTRPLADNLVPMLQRFADFHKLNPENGDAKTVNVQRFRPTIARLVILAKGSDVRLVKRVLGHRWVTTTIAYLNMSPYIQEELNANRYVAVNDPAPQSGTICSEMDLTPKSLSALLQTLEHEGRLLHAIGPGVFVTTDRNAAPEKVVPVDANEAISFLLDWAVKPAVRRNERVSAWLIAEAQRIIAISRVDYQAPTNRHSITYERIKGGSVVH